MNGIKKLILKIILISLVPISLIAFNFVVDSLQFYREARFYQPLFYDQQRYQNPGLAKNYEYDTAVIGTSMSENIKYPEITYAYPGSKNAVNLSAQGSTAYEQRLIMNLAGRNKDLRVVIMDINYCSLSGKVNAVRDENAVFPYHLYDNNPFNDYAYLANPNTFFMSFEALKQAGKYDGAKAFDDLNALNAWYKWSTFGKQVTIDKFKEELENNAFAPAKWITDDYEYEKLVTNINDNFYKMVKANPDVTFYCYFPPFSVLEHISFNMQGIFDNELKIRRYIKDSYKEYPNLRVYDFQTNEEIITNFDLYKDRAHHNLEVTRKVLKDMFDGKYLIDENFDTRQNAFEQLVKNFDINTL